MFNGINSILKSPYSNTKCILKSLKLFSTTVSPKERVNEKVIHVALVGVPNAGKSTLINNLIDRKVCPTSCKVHTTKKKAYAICTVDKTQIVFLDTPGMTTPRELKKYHLSESMRHDINWSVKNADIVGVLQDVGSPWSKDFIHSGITDVLARYENIPSFLILNKIDLLKSKRKLLDTVRNLCNNTIAGVPISANHEKTTKGYSGFSDVFMISALERDGITSLKEYLLKNAKPGKWPYPENDWTDQSPETLTLESIRAKFLDFVPQEIPYQLSTDIEHFEQDEKSVVCLAVVSCPSVRIMNLIAGAGDGKLQQISDSIRFDLVNMFRKNVTLTLTLKEDPRLLKK